MLSIDKATIDKVSGQLKGNDLDFFNRVWASPLTVYYNRLKAIDFCDLDHVLDAGFGVGQWTLPLCDMNRQVDGIEFDSSRRAVVRDLCVEKGIANIQTIVGSIEELPFGDNEFDGVFCYSVIFQTDFEKALREFYRVLKPGGKVYFTANDLGWYLLCMTENRNKSETYDPRMMAANTINHSLNFYSQNLRNSNEQLIMTQSIVESTLKNIGFINLLMGPEGSIQTNDQYIPQSFYNRPEYLGLPTVYECLIEKPDNLI